MQEISLVVDYMLTHLSEQDYHRFIQLPSQVQTLVHYLMNGGADFEKALRLAKQETNC